jgi:pseudouridine kinase
MGSGQYVVVIGGANMDIAGRPDGPLIAHDSNLGTVRLSHGGVGRNIAHNLALLGVDVHLITAFGDDPQAADLLRGCRQAGIDVSASLEVPDGATSTYLFVMDADGEMEVAINDMAILDHRTPAVMADRLDLINGAAACVVDTNLPTQTLAWLAAHVRVPLFCDPISTTKARKLDGLLARIDTLKPNRLQASTLTGVDIKDENDLLLACDRLLDQGLARAFISLGADGLLCAEGTHRLRLPLLPGNVVNTTGAGDAMTAALVWAHLRGLDLRAMGLAGLAASSIAVESGQTVSPLMSEDLLEERMRSRMR